MQWGLQCKCQCMPGQQGQTHSLFARPCRTLCASTGVCCKQTGPMGRPTISGADTAVGQQGPDLDQLGAPAQVVLVSATLPVEVLDMTNKFMNEPLKVMVKRDELTLEVGLPAVLCLGECCPLRLAVHQGFSAPRAGWTARSMLLTRCRLGSALHQESECPDMLCLRCC